MRPAVSDMLTRETLEENASADSDLVWLELDEVETECHETKELPADVAAVVRDTAQRLEDLDAHALLGVAHDADWTEIEHAYRKRLAIFHPMRWTGHRLQDLRPSMDRISLRLSHAFAHLAEVATNEGTHDAEQVVDRPTRPTEVAALELDFSGERPTFPSCPVPVANVQSISTVVDRPSRARPPGPPPRKRA